MKTQKTNNKTTTIPVKKTTKEKDVVKDIETEDGLLIKYLQTESTSETNIEANAVVSNEEETTLTTFDLSNLLSKQLSDYAFAPMEVEDYVKPVTYVLAGNGLFRVVKTDVALFVTLNKAFEYSIPGLPYMEEGPILLIDKLSFKPIIRALSFFRDVFALDKTESSLIYFWNTEDKELPDIEGVYTEGKLVAYCPKQVNSHTLTNYEDDEYLDWFRTELSILLELHSHCDFAAFFSGTDDANENMNQFYGVWGYVNKDEPMFAFRWVSGDRKQVCSPDILIEWPTFSLASKVKTISHYSVELNDPENLIVLESDLIQNKEVVEDTPTSCKTELVKGPFAHVDYPSEWLLKQHSTRKYTYTPYSTWSSANNSQTNYNYYKNDLYGDYVDYSSKPKNTKYSQLELIDEDYYYGTSAYYNELDSNYTDDFYFGEKYNKTESHLDYYAYTNNDTKIKTKKNTKGKKNKWKH